jgi:hypothetical protein
MYIVQFLWIDSYANNEEEEDGSTGPAWWYQLNV